MAAIVSSTEHVQFPPIETKSIYDGLFKDRNPQLKSAGKLTATGDTTVQCLKPPERPLSPEASRRFRKTYRPDAGEARVFYGKAYDPHLQWAAAMTHGLRTQRYDHASELVNPPMKTLFSQRKLDKKEGLYASHVRAPLGTCHDQRQGLPTGLDKDKSVFGIKTMKDGTAGELVNPDKSYDEVMKETENGRDLYRLTHHDFLVGESVNRNYVSENFEKYKQYGIPTPHDNTGGNTKKSLKWLHTTQSEKAAKIVSKRVDDFRDRTQPRLGQVHDPIADTLRVPADHSFGIMVQPDEYGAGDLLHGRTPGTYLRGLDRQRGVLAAIRQHLKKANYHNFHDLKAAFRHYDKEGKGRIDIHDLREACIQFHLPVEPELLEQLMDYCDVDRDGYIDYLEFANFLNWKDKLSTGLETEKRTKTPEEKVIEAKDLVPKSPQSRESTPRRLEKQIDTAIGDHRTSASMINAVVGGVSTRDYRTYGVPTIRTDIPAPRIRRVDDWKNYGDESDAYGLTNPSVYSQRGIHEKEFLEPRTRDQIKDIFSNVGIHMTGETLDDLYKTASQRHPVGHVSVESFRSLLDELRAADMIKLA